jgi:hypothetical protein
MRIFERFGAKARGSSKSESRFSFLHACARFPSSSFSFRYLPKPARPAGTADSVGRSLNLVEDQLLSIAEAMPESKYSFIPSGGNFDGVRSFGEQVKHAACAQFAFLMKSKARVLLPNARKAVRRKPLPRRN